MDDGPPLPNPGVAYGVVSLLLLLLLFPEYQSSVLAVVAVCIAELPPVPLELDQSVVSAAAVFSAVPQSQSDDDGAGVLTVLLLALVVVVLLA